MNGNDLNRQIVLTLGDHADDFDIDAIAADLRWERPGVQHVDDVSHEIYWEIVGRHDRTGE